MHRTLKYDGVAFRDLVATLRLLDTAEESRSQGVPPSHQAVVGRFREGLLEDAVVVKLLDRGKVRITFAFIELIKFGLGYLLFSLRSHDIGNPGALGEEAFGLVDDMVGQAAFKRLSHNLLAGLLFSVNLVL